MEFYKKANVYYVIRFTAPQPNILGISFGEDDVEVIEWNFNDSGKEKIQTSKEEVLKQVLSGLESINEVFGTNYKLSKIYFSPFDDARNSAYRCLIRALIIHYHNGNEFKPGKNKFIKEV